MRPLIVLAALAAVALDGDGAAAKPGTAPSEVVIDVAAGPTASFRPDQALGAALDGMGAGEVEQLYTPKNEQAMLGAGLGPVTYRLRTELGIEAWHWSEQGDWSDPARRQGYWVSDWRTVSPVLTTYGYALPRRGDTIDQANNLGYSRLDDGDPASFWKSNPYLDPRYTHDPAPRPQWAVLAFDQNEPIDAVRIVWAQPYARRYEVQYWVGADEYDDEGRWVTFPRGAVSDGRGGVATLRLAGRPIAARFVRILLETSSHTAPGGSVDVRDALGFAIGELGFGFLTGDGVFHDEVRHGAGARRQTLAYVSSTDPWHRAVDRDPSIEQPGLDRLFASGLTRGLPVMVPVGALYDTPENAAAEIRFLIARGYPIREVELGEEPDGQNIAAEDFGALYLEFADAVHAVDPAITVGGPSQQDGVADTWLTPGANQSWTRHFTDYLSARGRLGDLGFFSFERYPFDHPCGAVQEELLAQGRSMDALFARLKADGVPAAIPWIITEYGYSALGGQATVETRSALIDADMVGDFLTRGGAAAYLFGYGPNWPRPGGSPCAGSGELMLFEADDDGQARWPMPSYYAARMMTEDWAQPGDGLHRIFRVTSSLHDAKGRPLITAYALERPDRRWSVMLVNRDAAQAHPVRLVFRQASGGADTPMAGPMTVVQYGPGEYAWRPDADGGRPVRDLPPRRFTAPAGGEVLAPALSLTVITGTGPAAP